MEEATLLVEQGEQDDVTEITEVAKRLKANMNKFTSDLDGIRDRIENSAQCYHLLDKVNKPL